jgi:formate/nitrite transporter FocA (FNT family)
MIDTIDKSIIAGFLIGIGVIINTIATIPFLGALLFSFGLLVIIQLQLPLYTGKIGFLGKIFSRY